MLTRATPEATCKACAKRFIRARPLQNVCGFTCAARTVAAQKRAEKAETRARRLAIKPRSKWLSEAQAAFNFFIRTRDAASPCVSCGKSTGSHWDAGHYLTRGARPELRFNEANCHKQCIACNQHLHGNLILYRVELIKRIGLAAVEKLEGPNPPMHYSLDDLRIIKHTYRQRAKELEKQ